MDRIPNENHRPKSKKNPTTMHASCKYAALLAATVLASSSLSATQTVLDIDLNLFVDIVYDANGLNVKDYVETREGELYTDREFETSYPIFDGAPSYDAFGFASFEYKTLLNTVSPSFDAYEKYDWEISIDGISGYYAENRTNSTPSVTSDGSILSDKLALPQTSLADVTLGLTGLTPDEFLFELSYLFSPLSSSGSLSSLLFELYYFHDILLPLPAAIDPDAIAFDSDLGGPFGYLDAALLAPLGVPSFNGPLDPASEFLNTLSYAEAGAYIDINVNASRRAVPDSASTGLLAAFGLSLLIVARKRLKQ